MKVLFISRAFPPVVGGIENQNFEISEALPQVVEADCLINRNGKKFLPFFMVYVFAFLFFRANRYDVVLLGDGVLGVVAWWLKLLKKKASVVCVVHGLDLTYQSAIYQYLWVQRFLPLCDHFIAVGRQTIISGVERGMTESKFTFIPNGVHPDRFQAQGVTRSDLVGIITPEILEKKLILTSGRLAQRKGVAWFIRNVLPSLSEDVAYVVAGDGVDYDNIVAAISEAAAEDRVVLLGYVTDDVRNALFEVCDVFVQPNIAIPGDIEGFGITPVEAAVSGIPVIASEIEGLRDAITHEKSGFHVASGDPQAWKQAMKLILDDNFDRAAFGQAARAHVIEHNTWSKIITQYRDVMEKTLS